MLQNNCNKERVEVVTVVVMKIHFFLDETSCWSYDGTTIFWNDAQNYLTKDSITSQNTWIAATLLWEPQIYPGSQSCTVVSQHESINTELRITQLHYWLPYILESNPHPFYSFRGLKNQMQIRIMCGLDSRLKVGFWKNDRAAVRAIRTIQ